jgi:hypothetical protein
MQLDYVLDQTNELEVRTALRTLPSDLTAAFDGTMYRIRQQTSRRVQLALDTLMWLVYAETSLSVDVLRHALAAIPGRTHMDEQFLSPSLFLVDSCHGLVVIEKDTSIIRLIHQSVNEYLTSRCQELFPSGQKTVALHCLTYLTMDVLNSDFLHQDYFEWRTRNSKLPFLGYAANYWHRHAKASYDHDTQKAI